MFPNPPQPSPDRPATDVDERFTAIDVNLKKAPNLDEEELVTVATFPLANEAELAKLHLAEEGIQAVLSDAETVNMDWLLGYAIGGIKVQVLRSNAEAATEILSQFARRPVKLGGEEVENAEALVCLSCGTDITGFASKCPACGWSYESRDEGKYEAEA